MDRRQFTIGSVAAMMASANRAVDAAGETMSFTLNYAPHFGMFSQSAGKGLLDQLRFAADQGFRAWEDNPMKDRSVEDQTAIAKEMERLGIQMGVISALKGVWKAVNFAGDDEAQREVVLRSIQSSVEVAKRVNATFLTVVPGLVDEKLPADYQTVNCIDLLNRCCDIVEPHGLVMVLGTSQSKDQPSRRTASSVTAGLSAVQSSQSTGMQDLVRYLPSANHRRKLDSEYRSLLGRDRLHPMWRQSRQGRARDGRDQLSKCVRAFT